jgi:hypothetical protein
MQPCRGQSKTGSTHSFIEQALASALPLEPELLPPKMFPSGRVNPPDEDEEDDDDDDDVPVSSCNEASSPGGVPLSSPGGGAHVLHPPLLV